MCAFVREVNVHERTSEHCVVSCSEFIVQESLSSIVCLSQRVSEVKDVVLQVYIDKFHIATTRVFRYKETPEILSVQPDCSFDKYAAFVFSLSCFAFLKSVFFFDLIPFSIIKALHFRSFSFLGLSSICSGSRITIEGKNLDSVYRTVIHFKPKESHLKPVSTVRPDLTVRFFWGGVRVFANYLGLGFMR